MVKVVVDLVDLERVEVDKGEIKGVRLDGGGLVEEIDVSFEGVSCGKGVELDWDIGGEVESS